MFIGVLQRAMSAGGKKKRLAAEGLNM